MADSGFQRTPAQAQMLREKMTGDDEPLYSDSRKVQEISGKMINLTEYGAQTGSIEAGDELDVQVYREGIVIPFHE